MWRIALITIALLSAIAADNERSFSCDFERDTCGFTNQEGLTALWERREMELEGKSGYMMVVESNDTSSQIAKMITPYFEIEENIPGCFSFDLYTTGIKHFSIQQERDFGIISVYTKSKDQKQKWQKPRFDIDIDESTRFFFEAVLEGSDSTSIAAVDNVKLELKKC